MTDPAHDSFEPTFLVGDLIRRPVGKVDDGRYFWFIILRVVPTPVSTIGHYEVWCITSDRRSTISFMWANRNTLIQRP